MKPYLIPIYLNLGMMHDEKLLCGIFIILEEKIWFKYSSKRVNFSKEIIGNNSMHLAKTILDSINLKVEEINNDISNFKNTLFPAQNIINIEYFKYLIKYANNIIKYGEPVYFGLKINDKIDFDNFYNSILNEKSEEIKVQKFNIHNKIKSTFKKEEILKKADVGYTISPKNLTGLNFDTTVDLIAKNGQILVVDSVDFKSTPLTIGNTLNSFQVLILNLEELSKKLGLNQGKYHLLFNEPAPKTEQEKIFNSFYKNHNRTFDNIKFKSHEYVDSITKEIENKDYNKFSEFIENN